MSKKEIGKELSIAELKPRTIVVIAAPGRQGVFFTCWVLEVSDTMALFGAGEMRLTVVNFVRGGKLYDDQEREVRVFEYLGEP